MFFKKDIVKKLCTSELVYHLTFQDEKNLDIHNLEVKLYDRLNKKYKLDTDSSKKFIDLEKSKIVDRGQGLSNFLFGDSKSTNEVLKLFYTNEKKICMTIPVTEHFNELTFSELAILGTLFQALSRKYESRKNQILKLEKKELNSCKSKEMLERAENERKLAGYYNLLYKCMRTKMCNNLDYKNVPDYTKTLTILKEILFLAKQCENFGKEQKLLGNLSYDAFLNEKQIIDDNNVEAYIFKK